jgi:hypothetical protein
MATAAIAAAAPSNRMRKLVIPLSQISSIGARATAFDSAIIAGDEIKQTKIFIIFDERLARGHGADKGIFQKSCLP